MASKEDSMNCSSGLSLLTYELINISDDEDALAVDYRNQPTLASAFVDVDCSVIDECKSTSTEPDSEEFNISDGSDHSHGCTNQYANVVTECPHCHVNFFARQARRLLRRHLEQKHSDLPPSASRPCEPVDNLFSIDDVHVVDIPKTSSDQGVESSTDFSETVPLLDSSISGILPQSDGVTLSITDDDFSCMDLDDFETIIIPDFDSLDYDLFL